MPYASNTVYRYNDYYDSTRDYDQRVMEAWKPEYEYGQPLVAYYRFDDAGTYVEDFAFINDSDYYIEVPVTTNMAYRALGYDDADGDGLPEWWVDINEIDNYWNYQLGPYHYLDDTMISDYPVTFTRGWGTDNGTEGINTRVYYTTEYASLGTGNVSLITYNVWKDIDPVENTNDTLREDYEGKGIYNDYDEQIYYDIDWFTPEETAGNNSDIMYNDSDGSGQYSGGEDIWINLPGGDSGKYDVQSVMGIMYYRTFVAYASLGTYCSWLENGKYLTTKDSSVGYDGLNSSFFKYVYIDSKPESASMKMVTWGTASATVYVNGTEYNPSSDSTGVKLLSLLKQGRNAIFVKTDNLVHEYLDEIHVHYNIDYQRSLTWMKFDMALTVNGDELIRRGDDTVADPRSVWHGNAWSDFFQSKRGGDVPRPDNEGYSQLNENYGIPIDPDEDGINNYYEFKIVTNPQDKDSDNNGIPDGLDDFDGDGLVNLDEFSSASDPTLPDTDDDGLGDAYEKEQIFFSPANSMSPYVQRALIFTNGTMNDYMESPVQSRFNLSSFTIEAWVSPMSQMAGKGGYILRRLRADGGANGTFALGLDTSLRPYAQFTSGGNTVKVRGGSALPSSSLPVFMTDWSHVACTYDALMRKLSLYVNGKLVDNEDNATVPTFGYITYPVQRIGERFLGAIDEVRIWNTPQAPNWQTAPKGTETNLVAYYRFDDDTSLEPDGPANQWRITDYNYGQVQDYVERSEFQYDWENRWIHAGSLNGYVDFMLNKYLNILRMDGDSDADGMPDEWELEYPSVLSPLQYDAEDDPDNDDWDNLAEYLNGTNPNDSGSYPKPEIIFDLQSDVQNISGSIVVMVYDNYLMVGDTTAKVSADISTVGIPPKLLYTVTATDESDDRRSFSGTLPVTGDRTIQAGSVMFSGSDLFTLTDDGSGTLTGLGNYPSSGTIDYNTGTWTIQLNTNSYNGVSQGDAIYASWTELLKPTYPRMFTVSEFNTGSLRQGDNWIFVFVDENGNGTYDRGEYGGAPDVQPLSLRHGGLEDVRIGLTKEVQGYPRISWDTVPGASSYQVVINSRGGNNKFSKWVDRTFVMESDYMSHGVFGLPVTAGYDWYINTSNTPSVHSGYFHLGYPDTLAKPTALTPQGSLIASGHPTFRFRMTTNATLYNFQLLNSSGSVIWEIPRAAMPYIDKNGYSEIKPFMFYGYSPLQSGKTYGWRIRGKNPEEGWTAYSDTKNFTVNISEASAGPMAVRGDIHYFGKAKNVSIVVAASKVFGFSGQMYQQVRVAKVGTTNAPLAASKTPYALRALESGYYYIMAFIDLNNNHKWDAFESYGYLTSSTTNVFKPSLINVTSSLTAQNIEIRDVDTDDDNLPDAWEWVVFGDLTTAGAGNVRGYTDSDDDGLNALEEYNESAVDSDPTNPDTDNDGLSDGEEIITYGTDPKLQDTDGDGLPDNLEVEVSVGSNPLQKDTDGDTLPDGMEFDFNTGINSLNTDKDNDGYENILEIVGGFDPDDKTDHPDSKALFQFWQAQFSQNTMVMSFDVDPQAVSGTRSGLKVEGNKYKYSVRVVLQYRNGMDDQWQDVPAAMKLLGSGTQGDLADSITSDVQTRMYRLRWELYEE